MIRNIIFDIGNVLTDFCWKEFLEDKGFDQEMIGRIARASVLGPYWDELDRGVWSDEKLLEAFISLDPQIGEELHRAYGNVTGMVKKRDYAIPWIQELKKAGFQVYYLSNFSRRAYEDCQDALDFIPYMDGGILSYRDKVVKPGEKIYRLLLNRYGLAPEESVFLDDTMRNVEAAMALGFHGICFRDKEQAGRELALLMAGG